MTPDTRDSSVAAVSAIAGAINSGDSESLKLAQRDRGRSVLELFPSAWAAALCPGSGLTSNCVSGAQGGGTMDIAMGTGCSFVPGGAVWTGSLNYRIGGTSCGCSSLKTQNDPMSLAEGCSFTQTASVSPPTSRKNTNGDTLTLDTETVTGYIKPVSGGVVVTCGVGGCATQRSIQIAGMHITLRNPGGTLQWEKTVSTTAPLQVDGSGQSRVVKAGTVLVQHNRMKFSSTSTVTTPLTHQAGCCFPVGGSLTTLISGGGKLDGKTESITFGPGCGQASLTQVNGKVVGITLRHCL